jgi:hypothetical protein
MMKLATNTRTAEITIGATSDVNGTIGASGSKED